MFKFRILYCVECMKFVNAKKEKTPKGQPDVWYCPYCGTELG